ncbi:MAG: VOC family protein [Halobellus sp.]|uniref:VOC family protein n=1 Tax=Halobellus sp. TaxID=1979212 RepID=UPI0035D43DAD
MRLPPDTSLRRTALCVHELDEMSQFYRRVVGLNLIERSDSEIVLGAGDAPLLVLLRDEDATPRDPTQAGLFHTAFRMPSRAALGAALRRVRDHWSLDGASDHDISEALYLSDPEQNGVEIYRDRPRDVWPRSPAGTVEIGTGPIDLDAVAAASNGTTTVPPETTLGHVHLETTSLPVARSFYVDALGFGVQVDDRGVLFLAAGDYHHHFGLNTWNRRTESAGGRGLAWVEITVPEDDVVDIVRERLGDADVEFDDTENGIAFADPDGIDIRLRAE